MLALRRKPPFAAGTLDAARVRSAMTRASVWSGVLAFIRAWRERSRHRWELSQMSAHNLADLGIPHGSGIAEARRWPWQKSSRQWREISATRRDGR